MASRNGRMWPAESIALAEMKINGQSIGERRNGAEYGGGGLA